MTDDDLKLLAAFRAEVPMPDNATAQRIARIATAAKPRSHSQFPIRLPSRPRLALAVGLVALVLVPAALAFGGKIVDLFEGTPAPPSISSGFALRNRIADIATQRGFAGKFPQADVSRAHGVIEIQTADGPEDLWVAPNDQGGQCTFIDFANDTPGPNGPYGFGGCDPSTPPSSNITWGDVWIQPHPTLLTVFGHVYVDAATVQLTLEDGSAVSLPVVESFFLGSLAKEAKVTELTTYDTAGMQVAHQSANASGFEWRQP